MYDENVFMIIVLIAHQILQLFLKEKNRKTKYMAIKLDMKKAYSRIEWKFVEKCLTDLGFGDLTLLDHGMHHYSNFLYHHKNHEGKFKPSRGITRGFLIVIYFHDM